jgi:alpha-galactosidase
MSLKITLIGAGSVVFAKNLISDLLQFPELSDATICLMDTDPDRLKVAKVMTERIIVALKVKAKVVATLSQREAVQGARYVICTIQVGGYKPGTIIDFEIPRKYGLLQTIGDTLGIGGIFRALRTIPVINKIAQDIAEVGAPGCILLNYTNPMAMNCTAVYRSTDIPHVGLCHSVQGTSQQLASLIGLPYEEMSYLVAGINHMAFFLKFEYKGQDAYPLLFSLLNKKGFSAEKVRFEMMRRTGYFVTESSEHQSEYVPYFIHHGKKVIEQFDIPIDEYLRRCEAIIGTWEKAEAELLGGKEGITVNPQSHEYGSFIIHSRETNTPRVIYGNVPNRNLIDNLPYGACVELPCLVDAQGIQPTHIGSLPPQLAALCQSNINVQDLTVEAALTGKREHIYQAAMVDPHTATVLTLDKIWSMCDELIAEHQKHGLLGKFSPTIPSTGKAWHGTGDRIIAEVQLNERATAKNRKKHLKSIAAEILIKNPRAKAASISLTATVVSYPEKTPLSKSLTFQAKLPAEESFCKTITLPFLGNPAEGFMILLESTTPDVFVRDYIARSRPIFQAGGKEGAPFSMKLAGFPAVEGIVRVEKETVFLHAFVDDTKITPQARPHEGSHLALYFSASESSPIRELYLVPQVGAKKILFLEGGGSFHPVAGGRTQMRTSKKGAGYEVSLELPFSILGLSAQSTSFLFDLRAQLTALGDAHSGGTNTLSGHHDSHLTTSHYARIEWGK